MDIINLYTYNSDSLESMNKIISNNIYAVCTHFDHATLCTHCILKFSNVLGYNISDCSIRVFTVYFIGVIERADLDYKLLLIETLC